MLTIRQLLAVAASQLAASSTSPRLDAELLLAAALERPRSYLHAWPELVVPAKTLARFTDLVARRQSGEPIAYLLRRWEFWSLSLEVNAATLIPRPETELLVALALERLPFDRQVKVADLGTGSGAIALALATERPQAQIVATDQSAAALAVARRNAERLNLQQISFRQGHWCEPLSGERFDLIVANPPYIASSDAHWQSGALRFEPACALVAGADGLEDLRAIIDAVPSYLDLGAWLLLEHGYDQGSSVPQLLAERGFMEVRDYADFAGVSRCSGGRWLGGMREAKP